MGLSETDLTHLRRCVALAREGLDDGDEPFGSLLVDAAVSQITANVLRRFLG